MTEKSKINLLIVKKFFQFSLKFSKEKLLFNLNINIGENARNTPDKKPAIFGNTVGRFFPWSNLSPRWKEKEAKSLLKFHKITGV